MAAPPPRLSIYLAAPFRPFHSPRAAPLLCPFAHRVRSRATTSPQPSSSLLSATRKKPSLATPHPSSPSSKPRLYYTATTALEPPYPPTETTILAAAYAHVPAHGFTNAALLRGLHDAGYPASAQSIFPRGPFELFLYHLKTHRLALASTDAAAAVSAPSSSDATPRPPDAAAALWHATAALITARLHANTPILPHLPAALALVPQGGGYASAALAELGRLASEIVYLSGATALDSSWYARRAGVAGVYAASEVFMTQDGSSGWRETEAFVQRRVEGLRAGGEAVDAVGEWVGFSAHAALNLVRSWGWRV